MLRLADRILFTVAIGDADAHGRNICLLHPDPTTVRLAPLFDTVPTMLWPALRTDAAMSIGGITSLPAVSRVDIAREATRWGLSPRLVDGRTDQLLDRLYTVLTKRTVEMKAATRKAIVKRIDTLTHP